MIFPSAICLSVFFVAVPRLGKGMLAGLCRSLGCVCVCSLPFPRDHLWTPYIVWIRLSQFQILAGKSGAKGSGNFFALRLRVTNSFLPVLCTLKMLRTLCRVPGGRQGGLL